MKFTLSVLAGLAVAASAHESHDHHVHSHEGHSHINADGVAERCGTETDETEVIRATEIAQRFTDKVCSQKSLESLNLCLSPTDPRKRRQPVDIPVWYHVIHDGNTGNLTNAQVQAQFDQTNKDFAGQENPGSGAAQMDITFTLAGACNDFSLSLCPSRSSLLHLCATANLSVVAHLLLIIPI
jgi:hypothetical protein